MFPNGVTQKETARQQRLRQAIKTAVVGLAGVVVIIACDHGIRRRIVMSLGSPGKALVGTVDDFTRKRSEYGGKDGETFFYYHYADVNFQVRKNYAMTTHIELNERGLNSLREGQTVPIHFLPWLPSMPVLDEDFGSGAELPIYFYVPLIVVVWGCIFSIWKDRHDDRNARGALPQPPAP